jgi:dinuclear metal center YbgI/SA1388 family protein
MNRDAGNSRANSSPFLVEDLERVLESLAPRRLAEPWDTVGLLVGRRGVEVRRILVALDLTQEVVRQAATEGYQVILTHHPLLFRPLQRVTDGDRRGLLVHQLIAADLAYFALHTNLDAAPGGLAETAAEELGIRDLLPLTRSLVDWKKLVAFVPPEAFDKVSRAVYSAGAGEIGEYRECGYELRGEGTFLPSDQAQPHIGQAGRRERVDEIRWETVVPAAAVPRVVHALIESHPYEEPAFDLYPLENLTARTGQGRVGSLLNTLSLAGLAETVAEAFALREVGYAGDPEGQVDRVAVVPGSGGSLMEQAALVADVLITGDLRYHDAERAQDLGLALVYVPHGHLETWALRRWLARLRQAVQGRACEVHFSDASRSPWRKAYPVSPQSREPGVVHLVDVKKSTGVSGGEGMSLDAASGRVRERPDILQAGDDGTDQTLYRLHVDGGSRGNPGPSAIGVVLCDEEGVVVEEIGARIGHATNNVAEYQALVTGLETALDRGVRSLRIISDSELLVRQLKQEYRVKSESLKELFAQAHSLIHQFDHVEVKHVPRGENQVADALVNAALDGRL